MALIPVVRLPAQALVPQIAGGLLSEQHPETIRRAAEIGWKSDVAHISSGIPPIAEGLEAMIGRP